MNSSNLMKHRNAKTNQASDRNGAMLVLICVMIFAFVATVALSVDISYMHLVKSELRTATDAASKAASEMLSRTQDPSLAIARGKEVARLNLVANKGLELRDSDFVLGRSVPDGNGKFIFSTSGTPINSIRVHGTRNQSSIGGPVSLFFGRIFNTNSFQPEEFATATYIQRDIVLVVDRSGSMLDRNKFNELRAAITLFNSILANSPVEVRVGLASYSTSATADVQLTEDLSLINEAMDRMPVAGFTNISGGIDAGGQIMQQARSQTFVERSMIVLTDGLQNVGRPAAQAAAQQAAQGVELHAITFGSDADRGAMQNVANIGRGKYFHADNGAQLREVFEEIALTLSSILTE